MNLNKAIYIWLICLGLFECNVIKIHANNIWNLNRTAILELSSDIASRYMYELDSLQTIKSHLKDTTIADFSLRIANELLDNKKYNALFSFVNDVEKAFSKQSSDKEISLRMIKFGILTGEAYQNLSLWVQSAHCYLSLLDKAQKQGFIYMQATLYNNLASIYQKQGELQKSILLLDKSLEINKQQGNEEALIYNYNNLSSAYAALKDYDKSIEYGFCALHLLTSPSDSTMRMLILRNVAMKYIRIGEYSLALKYFQTIMDYQTKHAQIQHLAVTYKGYALALSGMGQTQKVRDYYEKALEYAEQGDLEYKLDILRDYSDFCKTMKDYSHAYRLLNIYQHLNDSITLVKSKTDIETISQLYLERQKQYNLYQQELEHRRELFILKLAVCIAVAVLLSLICIYLILYHRRKVNNFDLEKRYLEKKLFSLSLKSEHYISFIASLKMNLVSFQKVFEERKGNEPRMQLRRILSLVLKESDEEENYMDMMQTDFYQALLTRFPMLTSRDLRLCVLLRQGLTTKEIAEVTCKEIRSIETSRYRLRKKMQIANDEELCKFLNQLQ